MALFLKILEWTDDTKDTLVYKLPLKKGGTEINQKSKLIVRESQQAIFVHKGQICDIFPAGTYNLGTEIFPILSELSKVKELVKTDDLKQKLNEWESIFYEIKDTKIDMLTDFITEADFLIERKDYKNFYFITFFSVA